MATVEHLERSLASCSKEMAELDSFFAKKDKSKKKAKSTITIDDLAPESAEKQKKKKKKSKEKKDKDANASSVISKEEDAEWEDFKEEEKDYSGLKIQNLQISAKDEEDENEEKENSDEDEDGEKRDTGPQGPWNKVPAAEAPDEEIEIPKPKPKEEPAPTPPKTGKYIPPGLRNKMASPAAPAPAQARQTRKKVAPNLRNMEEFPTLGAAPVKLEVDTDPRAFEEVRSGGRSDDSHTKRGPELELENKYDALKHARD